jgi:hypothetical protein
MTKTYTVVQTQMVTDFATVTKPVTDFVRVLVTVRYGGYRRRAR